jgi:hypothetical protein
MNRLYPAQGDYSRDGGYDIIAIYAPYMGSSPEPVRARSGLRRQRNPHQPAHRCRWYLLLEFMELVRAFQGALSRRIASYNQDRSKFVKFVERYDRTISDSRMLIRTAQGPAQSSCGGYEVVVDIFFSRSAQTLDMMTHRSHHFVSLITLGPLTRWAATNCVAVQPNSPAKSKALLQDSLQVRQQPGRARRIR